MSLPWRTVSLFVSSTFRDTQLERDILVRRVFPRLRETLSKYRLNLSEIDLRWGVASEQDSVQVCEEVLAESLPRFLGIIGGRYGWIPDRDNPEGLSITEREMRMALEHPAARPVFLMREPAVPNGLVEPDSLTDADDPEHFLHKQTRLAELIRRIHASKSVIHSYQAACIDGKLSLEIDFEETAYSALLSSLERDPDLAPWFDLTDSDHEVSFVEAAQAFAHERTSGFNASLRSREIADLDVASKTEGYVLVTGGGGLGKTSLVAQAYLTASEIGDRKVVGAFVGGMRGTGSSHELLTNLVRSLSDDPPETEMTKLAEQFLSALHTAKPLIFLDGLDQLSDAGRLAWLPYGLPVGTTVVLSTMDDTLAQPFRDREAVEIRVDALSRADSRMVLMGHLHRYRKILEPNQLDALLSKADATSPLYLACVAEELRTLGVREELDKHIAAMPPDVGGLFLWVLRRLESDRQFRWEDGASKIRRLISCIGISRDGLSEAELSDLADDNTGDVAVTLRLLRPYLSRRGNLVSLHHRAHGEALRGIGIGYESRRLLGDDHPGYLDEESEVVAAREVLTTYFDGTESNVVSERQAYEWPHQLFHLKAWERLERCLLMREIFEHLSVDERKWELTSYWLPLRAEPLSRDMGALYLEAFEAWRTGDKLEDRTVAVNIGLFLWNNGLYSSAEQLYRYALEVAERTYGRNHPSTLSSMNLLAGTLLNKGDLVSSEAMYRHTLRVMERTLGNEHPSFLSTLNNLAFLLGQKGDNSGSESLHRSALDTKMILFGPDHPETLVSQGNLASLLFSKGDHSSAELLFRQSLEARERTLGPDHLDTLTTVHNLGVLLHDKGNLLDAAAMYRRAVCHRERILGQNHPDTLVSASGLAGIVHETGDINEAELHYRRVVAAAVQTLGEEHPDTLIYRTKLADVIREMGDIDRAEKLHREVLEAREGRLGKEHPDTLTSLAVYAGVLFDKCDVAGAKRLLSRVLEAQERILGPKHPNTLTSVNNMAFLLRDQGDLAGAEPLYRRALEAREKTLGSEHPDTLTTANNLAVLKQKQGNFREAEAMFRRTLETQIRVLGSEHPNTLASQGNLASLIHDKRDLAGAEQMYRSTLKTQERILGKEHRDTLKTIDALAKVLTDRGDFKDAESLYRHSLEVRERLLGAEHSDTLASLNRLASFLVEQGDFSTAESMYRRVLEARERHLGEEHPLTLQILSNLAKLSYAQGDLVAAESLFRRDLEASERLFGFNHRSTLTSVNNLASLLGTAGDIVSASLLHRRALEARERTLGPEHPDTIMSINNLAVLYARSGDLAGAEPLFCCVLEVRERVLGLEHPQTVRSRNNLAFLKMDKGDLTSAEVLFRLSLEARTNNLGAEHSHTRESATNLERMLDLIQAVESLQGRSECDHCLGTGFVAYADIMRLEMQSELKPGPCKLCRETAGLDDKT
jgi:tetratricopeptide (TPR) repeat protein